MNNKDIEKIIYDVFNSLEKNNFETLGRPDEKMWEEPLIGIASGEDKYYSFLKEHIGEFHWSPEEAFKLKYKNNVKSKNLKVISLAFPQTRVTKRTQKNAVNCPSKEWIVTRGEWEPLMKEFSTKIVKEFEERGIRILSIDMQTEFSTHKSEKLGLASNWSHRHTGFIAGLGTFGLSEGLITKKGKAVRMTSFIVEAPLIPTEREYKDHNEWCLYYKDGSCKVCIKRCPISAISEDGHDKISCEEYEDIFYEKYWPTDIEKGDYILGCGLCQVGIPCQNKKPFN